MDLKVLIFTVVTVTHLSAGVVSLPGAVFYLPLQQQQFFPAPLDVVSTRSQESEDLVVITETVHKEFIKNHNVSAFDQYNYGVAYYDWKTAVTHEQYESRFGDVAYGSATKVFPGSKRITVHYTVDPHYGFQSAVSKGIPVDIGSSGIVASTIREHPPSTSQLRGHEVNPHVKTAYEHHKIVKDFLKLEPPLRLYWGYTLKKASGRTRGQYESSIGSKSDGRFTVAEVDGSKVNVYYIVDARGFHYFINKT